MSKKKKFKKKQKTSVVYYINNDTLTIKSFKTISTTF